MAAPITHARGSVVLTDLPFTDLSGSKLRPALVVTTSPIGKDIVVLAISSIIRGALAPSALSDCLIELSHPEFPLTGLRVASVIRTHRLATIEQSRVVRRLGNIGPLLQAEVDKQLRQILGL